MFPGVALNELQTLTWLHKLQVGVERTADSELALLTLSKKKKIPLWAISFRFHISPRELTASSREARSRVTLTPR